MDHPIDPTSMAPIATKAYGILLVGVTCQVEWRISRLFAVKTLKSWFTAWGLTVNSLEKRARLEHQHFALPNLGHHQARTHSPLTCFVGPLVHGPTGEWKRW